MEAVQDIKPLLMQSSYNLIQPFMKTEGDRDARLEREIKQLTQVMEEDSQSRQTSKDTVNSRRLSATGPNN